jgi:hypothetical protein
MSGHKGEPELNADELKAQIGEIEVIVRHCRTLLANNLSSMGLAQALEKLEEHKQKLEQRLADLSNS